jgi:hypothetical protein
MIGRRLARTCLASLCVAAVAATATANAHAAPPEMPDTLSPESVAATSATFKGVLNATVPGELGSSYQFLYKASATQCEGANGAPEPPAPAFGGEHEEVAEAVAGLSPQTTYTVCLLERNAEGEATVGAPVTFTTALPPEVPETLEAASVTGSTATLRGVLNPNATGEAGTYEFLYRASATECEGERSAPEPAAGVARRREMMGGPARPVADPPDVQGTYFDATPIPYRERRSSARGSAERRPTIGAARQTRAVSSRN